MKKIILLVILLLIGAGAFWYFSTEQRLKRKTLSIIEKFTVEEGQGNISGATGALLSDGLFSSPVKLETNIKLHIPFAPIKNGGTASPEQLSQAIQALPSFFSNFEHELGKMEYEKLGSDSYLISFDHKFSFILKGGGKAIIKLDTHTSFIYTKDKKDGKLKLSKVILNNK